MTNVIFSFAGDTASNLGNAMDELMRHQPSLRTDATKAIIKVNMLNNFFSAIKLESRERIVMNFDSIKDPI